MTDRTSAGEARRAAMTAALSLGFDEQRRSDIGIVATEAATNMLLHAKDGELLISDSESDGAAWLDMVAVDRGPGIRDMSRAMEDGFSTIGTAGQGLGAIRRLSNKVSVYSLPDRGTVVWSRFSHGAACAAMNAGAVNIPVKGEMECGDGYLIAPGEYRSLYVVVDGLGHGSGAKEAADAALTVTKGSLRESAGEIMTRAHDALKKTRGAAMSIALVNHQQRIVLYSSVGNISASLTTGGLTRNLVSQNGTVGAVLPRVQEYTYPFETDSLLVMYSDGLNTKCSISGYPGLQQRHPQLITGVLYRDFSRKRDDATVIAARLGDGRA